MEVIFQAKQVLDEMNRIGPNGNGIQSIANKAAFNLYMTENDPAVILAMGYVAYELKCFTMGQKPDSLAKWFIMNRKKVSA